MSLNSSPSAPIHDKLRTAKSSFLSRQHRRIVVTKCLRQLQMTVSGVLLILFTVVYWAHTSVYFGIAGFALAVVMLTFLHD